MILSSLANLTFFRGRVALYAILKAFGVGKGNEVATQAFTCVAVPEAIMATGAIPCYIDVESMGFNMDAEDLANKITPKTRAIVVQHTFGIPADMDCIAKVARQADIPIIEDCCHTLVSTYKGRLVGTFGVGGFYSFEWGKPIVVGIGGSVQVNDPIIRSKIQDQYVNYRFPSFTSQLRLRLQYIAHHLLFRPLLYWPVRSLYHTLSAFGAAEGNYNPLLEGEAVSEDFALKMSKHHQKRLVCKLGALDKQTSHSQWVASEYRARIDSTVVSHPKLPENSETIFARYPLVARNKSKLLEAARKANVELADWYSTPIHPIPRNHWQLIHYKPSSCPNAEARSKQIVSLPTHCKVKKRDIDHVVRFLNEITI